MRGQGYVIGIGPRVGQIPGLFGTPGADDVAQLHAVIASAREQIQAQVLACQPTDRSFVQGWALEQAAVLAYLADEPDTFRAPAQYATGQALLTDLNSWRTKLAQQTCAKGAPAPQIPPFTPPAPPNNGIPSIPSLLGLPDWLVPALGLFILYEVTRK